MVKLNESKLIVQFKIFIIFLCKKSIFFTSNKSTILYRFFDKNHEIGAA